MACVHSAAEPQPNRGSPALSGGSYGPPDLVEQTRFLSEKQDVRRLFYGEVGGKTAGILTHGRRSEAPAGARVVADDAHEVRGGLRHERSHQRRREPEVHAAAV